MRSRSQAGPKGPFPWIFLTVCTLLLVGSGALLAYHQYQHHNRIVLACSDPLLTTVALRVQRNLDSSFRGPRQALNLLAQDPLWRIDTLERRLGYLGKLTQVLNDLPQLNSIYLSWEDGDFLQLRPLISPEMRERFDAPVRAVWLVWHIGNLAGQREAEHRFYDEALRLVETRSVALGGFDPRTRPWHRLASQQHGAVVTPPYVFHSTGEFGTSIARPADQGVVLGADITLDRLSNGLAGHGLAHSAELLLYDAQGTVVAYHDALRIRSTTHGSALRLRTFHELGSTLLARLAEDGYAIERRTTLALEGQRWLVLQQQLRVPSLPGIYLAVLVPEGELLETADDLRRESLLTTLAATLTLSLLLWIAAWFTLRRGL